MMKKMCMAISTAGIFALISAASAFADTACSGFIDSKGNMNVSIVSGSDKEELYTVYIMERDAELKTGVGAQIQEGLVRLEQAASAPDENKRYSNATISVGLTSGVAGGLYKAVIGGGGLSGKKIAMVYPAEDTAQEAFAALSSADEGSIGGVLEKYQDKAWSVDLNDSFYQSNKRTVDKNLVRIIKEGKADIDDVTNAFNSACTLANLAQCGKEDFYNILLKNEYALGTTQNSTIYAEKPSIAAAFVNLRADNALETPSDLDRLLRKAEALGLLNDSTRENVLSILTDYNDVFGLDFNGDYKKVDSYSVMKKMTPDAKGYKSISDVQTAFKGAVSSLLKDKGSSGGGASYGGGGAASSNYVTAGLVESVTKSDTFADISDAAWAEVYINYLHSREVISGYGDGNVYPNAAVTREQFLRMLITAINPEMPETEQELPVSFADVDAGAWYADSVGRAVRLGIVYGINESIFGVGMQITREDAAVMLCRAVEAKKKVLAETAQPMGFADETDISGYALNSVKAMQRAGIISGYEDGSFLPKNPVTRAEAAVMIYNVLKNIKQL